MLKQVCLYFVIFLTLTTHKCYVSSGSAPGNTIVAAGTAPQTDRRYSTHSTSNDEHYNHRQQQQVHPNAPQHNAHSTQQHHGAVIPHHHSAGGGGGSNVAAPVVNAHAVYHPGSGAHIEHRNSYNLLSEAMSQAVSNEFSALGSGSADGACHADDLDCYSGNVQDRLGMEAIRTLHRQLDDDDNGNIDLSESDDFLREELKYDSGYEKRQKAFHFNDDMHISVKELWEAWLRSEVHNWTIEQTTDWLAQSVQLPQYVELFKVHKVAGAALPRLAVNNMHYVGNVLGIKDPIHKQKIALKAMDVVLFGPPRETGTRWKDYILVTLLLSAIIGCWYAYQQNKNAKRHLRRMAQDMEGLQRAEQSLQEMQKELERARMEQENVATEKMDLERRLKEAPSMSSSSSDLEVQQLKKEIEMLRTELSRAEIELVDNCWSPPPQLQSWLQYTYELESKNHMKKRVSAEKQLQTAREACEKLRKKRSSLVGAFVSTHGKSIDDVDRSIVEARNSLGEVTNELQERLHRWKQIESCLGLNIVNNNGLPYLESILYGRNGVPSKSSRGRMTSSTDDLDDDSVQGMLDSYSRSSVSAGLGSSIINSSSNTIRDDSSCSDDGADTPQGVQFYLGSAPSLPVPANLVNTSTQRAHLPLDVTNLNHIGNNVTAATPVPISTSSAPATNLAPTANAPPPPLPPHNSNAHSSLSLNDSQLLRSQSTELVPMEIYSFISRQQQQHKHHQQQHHPSKQNGGNAVQQQFINTGGGNNTTGISAIGGGGSKKMVKQHSTASQQSTSSTSSSVQSAPANIADNGNGHSPGRWSSHERVMPLHHHEHQLIYHHQQQQYHQQQQQQQQHQHKLQQHIADKEPLLQSHYSSGTTTAAVSYQHRPQHQMSASHSLQSLCGKPQYGSGTSTSTAASAVTTASSYNDNQLEGQLLLAAIDSSSSIDGNLKKRKRRLRFPFGSSIGSRKSSASSGIAKSKHT